MSARYPPDLVLHPCDAEANPRDTLGGIGKDRATRLHAHRDEARGIGEKSFDIARQILSEAFVVFDDNCAFEFFDHAGVVKLLHIAMKRIRHKNRRAGGKRDIGDGAATAARDHQVRRRERARHVIYNRNSYRLTRTLAVSPPHPLNVRLPGLMCDLQLYNTFSPDFESL